MMICCSALAATDPPGGSLTLWSRRSAPWSVTAAQACINAGATHQDRVELPGKRASYGRRQPAAVGSVLVDVGVVDRNLQSRRLAGGDGRAQDGYPVVPGEAVWARVVDGLHDRLIEDVCVQVDPEPVGRAAVTGQEGHRLAGGGRGAGLSGMLAVQDQHVAR